MASALRVLLLEDSEDDALLLIRELRRGAYVVTYERIDSPDAMVEALSRPWDLIISDYSMPRFDPLGALRILREKNLDIPFIVVSGSVSETTILEAMKAGASDYLMKDNLTRLTVAVSRELREAEMRRQNRSLEEQFRQAQKMEAVGRLAGGVAHDFNNLLTVITGYSDLLLMKSDLDPSDRSAIEEIKRAGERGSGLTRQLLAFSRRQALEMKTVPLNDLLIQMEKMLRRLIGEDVDLVTDARAERSTIKIDPGQLEQVVMNLVVNARDAMPGGGKLTIQTSNEQVDELFTRVHPGLKAGPCVMLTITDTGTGMGPETLSHIFEPFYTTKPQGQGTGLGMATAYGIIKQSGGAITVESSLGTGSVIRIYLPVVAPAVDRPQEQPRSSDSIHGHETILLLEDETRVRKLVREILSFYGYTVLEASRGEEAVGLALTHPGPIDLILSDVILPGMSGPEAVKQVTALRPGIRILYTSGYTDEAFVHYKIGQSGAAYLQKPFLPTTLATKIRELLEDASPQTLRGHS